MEKITLALCALTFGASVLALLLARRNLTVAELSRELAQKSLAVELEREKCKIAVFARYAYSRLTDKALGVYERREWLIGAPAPDIAITVFNQSCFDITLTRFGLCKNGETRIALPSVKYQLPVRIPSRSGYTFYYFFACRYFDSLGEGDYIVFNTADGSEWRDYCLLPLIARKEALPERVEAEKMG